MANHNPHNPDHNPNQMPSDEDKFARMKREYEEAHARFTQDGSPLAGKVKDLIDESIPDIAKEMVRLSLHASRESLRFQAARYLLDNRVFNVTKSNDALNEWLEQFDSLGAEAKPPSEAG